MVNTTSTTTHGKTMMTPAEFRACADVAGIELRPEIEDWVVAGDAVTELIDLVESLDLVILGFEGLQVEGAHVMLVIDYIADLGEVEGPWETRVQESAASARRIAVRWGPMPDLVTFVLEGLDEQ